MLRLRLVCAVAVATAAAASSGEVLHDRIYKREQHGFDGVPEYRCHEFSPWLLLQGSYTKEIGRN